MVVKYKNKLYYGKRINNKIFEIEAAEKEPGFELKKNEAGRNVWAKKIFLFSAEFVYSAKFEVLYHNIRFKAKYVDGDFILYDRDGKNAGNLGFELLNEKWQKIVSAVDIDQFYVLSYDYKNKHHIRKTVTFDEFISSFEQYQKFHRSRR